MKQIDFRYYRTVVETQNDPDILKAELMDLILEAEATNDRTADEILKANEVIEDYIKILEAKLKEASRGEVDTWGFVAMFMEMINSSKEEYFSRADA